MGDQQFEYIMGEIEADTPEKAVEAYKTLKKAYYVGGGIPEKEYVALYDMLRLKGSLTGDPGIISQMSIGQRFALNELKKSLKRVTK